jgi:hypothetical protein
VKVIDPVPFMGIDSGMRRVVVTAREAAILRATAAIVDRVHDELVAHQGDGHYDADLSLCGVSMDLERMARSEVEW